MKNIYAIYVLFCFISNMLYAFNQDSLWVRTYGGTAQDDAVNIQSTKDSCYIIAGGTYSFGAGSQDFWLLKVNNFGDTLWTKTYGESGDDRAYSVKQTRDDGYILTGYTTNPQNNNKDILLIKTDSTGEISWTKKYDKNIIDWGLSVQQTIDAGFIIVGFTQHQNETDIWLIKTDSNGDTTWTKFFGGNFNDWSGCVEQTSDSGFILTGFTEDSSNTGRDVWIIKTDNFGDTLWTKKYGGNNDDWGRVVKQTSDGGYILGCVTNSMGSGGSDIWLIKTDASGDSLWTKIYGGIEDDWVYSSIQQTIDFGYVIAGGTYSYGAGDSDAWLIKTDSTGDSIWTKIFGGSEFDNASAVVQNKNGGYVLAGATKSFGLGDSDFWIIKTDSSGNTPIISTINNNTNQIPQTIKLFNNYPNPFNSTTIISFSIPKRFAVDIKIYDILGREIKTIISENLYKGLHHAVWDGTNHLGNEVSSGVYIYTLIAKALDGSRVTITNSAKLVLLR